MTDPFLDAMRWWEWLWLALLGLVLLIGLVIGLALSGAALVCLIWGIQTVGGALL